MPDRATSEVLGYVLVFSLVVLTVALVTVSGQAGLADLRDNQQTANVETGFGVLAENVDDLVRDGAPSRATELDPAGGRLGLGPSVEVAVSATFQNGTVAFDRTRTVRPLVYRGGDGAQLAYATGAVLGRGAEGGVVMLREPRLLLSRTRTVVPVVNTTLDRRQLRGAVGSVDTEGRVLVRTERRQRRVNATDEQVDLTLAVTSPRAAAWETYLDSAIDPGSDDCSLTGNTASCSFTTDRAAVVLVRVAVSFE